MKLKFMFKFRGRSVYLGEEVTEGVQVVLDDKLVGYLNNVEQEDGTVKWFMSDLFDTPKKAIQSFLEYKEEIEYNSQGEVING